MYLSYCRYAPKLRWSGSVKYARKTCAASTLGEITVVWIVGESIKFLFTVIFYLLPREQLTEVRVFMFSLKLMITLFLGVTN